jgi:Holliday junction resolvase-like predicted endonuclease
MSIENNLIISLLKLTKEGPALIENVKNDTRIPLATTMKLLEKLQTEGLVYLKHDTIEADANLRLKLAVKAEAQGADVERVSNLLHWQEFEAIAAATLRKNGYAVSNNVRFKHAGRKWEVDVVGCRKPLVICIDCKHWQHAIAPSTLQKIVDAQVERTRALADSLPNISLKLECAKWSDAKFVPSILSLFPNSFKFYGEVPIVPILQLQDFINQLPAYTGSVKFFHRSFNSLTHNL